jgi:hypothetical protein
MSYQEEIEQVSEDRGKRLRWPEALGKTNLHGLDMLKEEFSKMK